MTACQKKERTVEELIDAGDLTAILARRDKIKNNMEMERQEVERLDKAVVNLDPTEANYPLVTAVLPMDTLFNHYIEVQGSVMTKNDAMIFPEYSGVMTNLYVSEGQYVKRGALLASVDDGGLNQQIAQQQVQLQLARTTYDRQKRLWDQNIGSEMQYLQAKNNYEALQ